MSADLDGALGAGVFLPAQPGRADLDPVIADGRRRVVVEGDDADLAAVLVRLLRTERLDIEVAYVAVARRSAAARAWGLPTGRAAAALALDGAAAPVPWSATTSAACSSDAARSAP